MNTKFFPALLMLIDCCAALVYALNGDWRRALYWFFAFGLTATVTI